MSTPSVLNELSARLVRCGLPVDYAQRAAAELADHHRDLVNELCKNGLSESAARMEASRRLGDERTLVKNTVREYQRRFWCGRWPLISFVLAPTPAMICGWLIASFASVRGHEFLSRIGQWLGMSAPGPATIGFLKLIVLGGATAIIAPLVLTLLFYHLARRSGGGSRWALVSVLQIAFLASLLNFHVDSERGILFFEPAMLRGILFAPTITEFLRSYFVQSSQALQFALPLAAFGVLVWYERRRQRLKAASIGWLALS